jgi:hypothetical protein
MEEVAMPYQNKQDKPVPLILEAAAAAVGAILVRTL